MKAMRASVCAERESVVRTGEMRVVQGSGCLVAFGVGSCVILALFDPLCCVAGMAHVFLPSSGGNCNCSSVLPAKYADRAVPELQRMLVCAGANPMRIRAKLAGGANLFSSITSGALEVGKLNVAAVESALERIGIPVVGSDIGGRCGRTIYLMVPSMAMKVSYGDNREVWI
ncbi:MAG: chemotaxis protein CheD [Bacillota bacterium]